RLVDLTEYYCTDTVCPAVIGGVLVHRDATHLTNTFAVTLAPYLGDPDLTEERAAELRATLVTCGARAAAESRIAEHAALARAELAGLPYDLADRLEGLVTELVERAR
ncbi:polyprenyl synthetase family protein, partial [Bacillus sp. S34]|nr:polyprenyl synthetase family protein [Bacillus sp. S34]